MTERPDPTTETQQPPVQRPFPFGPPRYRGRRKRQRTVWTTLLDVLIIAIFLTGIYLVAKPAFVHWQQDRLTKQLDEMWQEGDGTIVIDEDAWQVEGEELEYVQLEDNPPVTQPPPSDNLPSLRPTRTPTAPAPTTAPTGSTDGKITIKAIGQIEIDRIDLKMPIAERSTAPHLRVAIGHYSPSPAFGENGLTVLLGHRMYTYGRHFNRLGEVKTGDPIIISDKTTRYTYQVDQIDIVEPAEMLRRLTQLQGDSPRLMLVTCHPVRVASHRMLVYAELIETEPIG
ncbi:MAG: class D sortase [Eubacteriales bacterium]|nr:class D sortase [Eubacteriales bacterium]